MNSLFRLALCGAIFALTIKILVDLDFNKVVFSHTPGKCEYIEGLNSGSEDIVMLKNGLALISSGMLLRAPGIPYDKFVGKIYLYDVKTPEKRPKNLAITGAKFYPAIFRPAGLTVWETEEKTFVYAVNTYNSQIYYFELNIEKKSLTFIKALSHPDLTNPNNIIAVADNRFYVSNFFSFSTRFMANVELALQLPLGSVFFYDGEQFVEVLNHLKGPNGVAVSPNKDYLYVALHMAEQLRVYKINDPKNLTEVMQISIPSGLDNVNCDDQGHLWIGAQQIIKHLLFHMYDPITYIAPSQVLKVSFDPEHKSAAVEEIYADDGELLRASTTAAVYKNILLIGTLYDKAMWCQLPG